MKSTLIRVSVLAAPAGGVHRHRMATVQPWQRTPGRPAMSLTR